MGKLRFTRAEVIDVLTHSPRGSVRFLDDARWFHSLDEGYRGRAVFDPQGFADALAQWLTDARFLPEVVRARQQINQRQVLQRYREAKQALDGADVTTAEIALRESLHVLMRYLMEGWGERDTSFARFGTRFESEANRRGARDLAEDLFALYQLSPSMVTRRMALAPEGIRYRHRLSFAARQLVDERVTAEQDARDVLLVFGTMRMRRKRPPYEAWLELGSDDKVLSNRLGAYGQLLGRVGIGQSP